MYIYIYIHIYNLIIHVVTRHYIKCSSRHNIKCSSILNFQTGYNINDPINVSFPVFVFIIPGKFRLPRFEVKIGYHQRYRLCKRLSRPKTFKNIKIQCSRRMRGDSMKIMLIDAGQLSLCEVAVYANNS